MVVKPNLSNRADKHEVSQKLESAGIHPLLARLWAARGVTDPAEANINWSRLIPPYLMTGIDKAANRLADAIENQERILIIADYDCDGATACAVGIRALRAMNAVVDFLVPNRFETGYGLSPAVVELALNHTAGKPDILLTVDNGIASVDGVEAANAFGMEVIVTDHHLPGDVTPNAVAIVNPNQNGCNFPSKNLAGVGVIFYVMMALRAELRKRQIYPDNGGPRLDHLSDLVALGTISDVVPLDVNNRLLVNQGLKRIRSGQMHVGLRALFAVAARDPVRASSFDMGFALGPRINAAGRMADMSVGINLLTTDDESVALQLARELDQTNQHRRNVETTMREEALVSIEAEPQYQASICVYQPDWHQGVVGLVASRVKETYWRPTLAFARGDDGELRGSGRSIPDVHLRDALDLVSKRHPGIILKFGGHAMAAGLSLKESAYDIFVPAFDQAVTELTGKTSFSQTIETDGSLETGYANTEIAALLESQIWGAGFPAPIFRDEFQVLHQRILKEKHLKLILQRGHQRFDAIWFNHNEQLPEFIEAAYRLDLNVWNGNASAQLIIEHAA